MPRMPKFDNIPRLTIDKLNNDGCFRLLEAFLKYVAEDYCSALRTFLKDKNDKTSYKHLVSARNFFLSDYFSNLTGLCGEDIVSRLDTKVMCGERLVVEEGCYE